MTALDDVSLRVGVPFILLNSFSAVVTLSGVCEAEVPASRA